METLIESPDDPALEELCRELSARADDLDASGAWPSEQLALCGRYGVYRWFVSAQWGGFGWSDVDVVRGYLELSAACLTTTFVITQRTGACRRIASSDNLSLKERLLPHLLTAERFATVGISHLTTSRRHLAKPVLTAKETDDGFVLDGYSPWVTGGVHADVLVVGATLDDDRQVVLALPTDLPGMKGGKPARLIGVESSHTGPVHFDQVAIDREWLLAGPMEQILTGSGEGATSGGLQTSTLAVGLASAAIGYLENESRQRPDLAEPADALRAERDRLKAELLRLAAGESGCTLEELRTAANSLVLRACQAALAAAKGAGYIVGHPTGRWCREALFFLVWSCPQPVMAAQLCEFAGLSD